MDTGENHYVLGWLLLARWVVCAIYWIPIHAQMSYVSSQIPYAIQNTNTDSVSERVKYAIRGIWAIQGIYTTKILNEECSYIVQYNARKVSELAIADRIPWNNVISNYVMKTNFRTFLNCTHWKLNFSTNSVVDFGHLSPIIKINQLFARTLKNPMQLDCILYARFDEIFLIFFSFNEKRKEIE